ncbi:MAG TPA: prephenate dehydrogenase/arogenate dehydrogenase family protein [Anaerolineales bacterium]|nr:prephenate dehydrogenase/arogenate dehydrogenase family protein [Anaerolineales bacterium]
MVIDMEAGFRLEDSKIAIIGLGLMGGSLALALKGKCAALYGIDAEPATLELALEKKIVHQAGSEPANLLPRANLVILATPVPAIVDYIQSLPSFTENPCIVLDLGSTKRDILRAMEGLPERFDPIGGHPICGKEMLGLENADPNLYQGAPFVVTTLERTTSHARSLMRQLVTAVGARWIEVDADEHDRALAYTSHLPFLVSSALAGSLPQEFAGLIGTGFRSTSRLAGTPSHMTLGILQSNRDNILKSIESFQGALNEMAAALRTESYPQLETLLTQSRSTYQSLISNL